MKQMAQDPLITGGTRRLAFENDRARVLDVNLTPGGKVAMHSHPGYMVIPLDKSCTIRYNSPDGKEEQAEIKAGEALWREAGSHSMENIGRAECHVLRVELKQSNKATDRSHWAGFMRHF